MARIITNKFPLDLDDRMTIGFKFPFSGDAVFLPTYTTKDQIKANIINYMLTNKGERMFNPEFGADLRSMLFNNINLETQSDLINIIQDDINEFFPDVVINELKFENQIDNNIVHLIMDYSIKSFGIEDNINISIS